MKNCIYTFLLVGFVLMSVQPAQAGNPDRQGEAGAYELLLNPWGRSTGLHSMTTAYIKGVEAIRLNVAGLANINQTEVSLGRSTYLQGTGIYLNAAGFGQRIGKSGVLGMSIMSVDFGDIPVTTTSQPEGTGGTFSPSFFNLGLSYAHLFENKVSVGATLRVVSEATANVSAQGVAIDAGIQYVTGELDNIRLGISLRNIGTPMRFSGEGLSFVGESPNGSAQITINQRAARYELPSVLNIGGSYDFIFDAMNKLTIAANFTSNSFSRDQIGGGLEYSFKDMFMVRGGYKYELGSTAGAIDAPVYTGLAAGATLEVPLKKETDRKFGIDYSYRTSNPWGGSHNLGIRVSL